ncbi:zinc-ribbon domain-containing protein [Xinfangfangia pollutisoli]|uniref:zinc-ribbon domain-containing protein n=1 Tax=Xinfangfangia pollutisoli TaxID=2865960 RepID=UPI001CD6A173|nr:zinc-ribbon domain-containing protein [Xinfangfangia pollutisoli]
MRLACPNCDAKYEVPDDAIPEAGRDVQCSNCGHAWFQLRPEAELDAELEAALYGDEPAPAPAAAAAPLAAPQTPPAPADADADLTAALAGIMADTPALQPDPGAPQRPGPVPEEDYIEDLPPAHDPGPGPGSERAPEPAPVPAPKRAMDEAVLAVLREEAEREAEARRHEAQLDAQRADSRRAEAERQMQIQPDLGMADPAPAPRPSLSPTQRRLAMLKGEDPDAAPPEPARPPARRDLLPNVEELTSTLRPGEAGDDADEMADALPDLTRGRASFRAGFLLMLFVALIAAAVYVAAPSLSAAVPALQAPLAAYVIFVDGLRAWLDGVMNQATQALTGAPKG